MAHEYKFNRESPFRKMAAVDVLRVPVACAIADVVRLCGFIVLIEEQKLSKFKVYLSRLPLFSYTHHVLERNIQRRRIEFCCISISVWDVEMCRLVPSYVG